MESATTEWSPLLAARRGPPLDELVFEGRNLVLRSSPQNIVVKRENTEWLHRALFTGLTAVILIVTLSSWIWVWAYPPFISIEIDVTVFLLQGLWAWVFAFLYHLMTQEDDVLLALSRSDGMLTIRKKRGLRRSRMVETCAPVSEIRRFRVATNFTITEKVGRLTQYGIEVVALGALPTVFLSSGMNFSALSQAEVAIVVQHLNAVLIDMQALGGASNQPPIELLHSTDSHSSAVVAITEKSFLRTALPANTDLRFKVLPVVSESVWVITRRSNDLKMAQFVVVLCGMEWLLTVLSGALLGGEGSLFGVGANALVFNISILWLIAASFILGQRNDIEGWMFGLYKATESARSRGPIGGWRHAECQIQDIERVDISRSSRPTIEQLQRESICGEDIIGGRRFEIRLVLHNGNVAFRMGMLTEGEALCVAYKLRLKYPQMFRGQQVSERSEGASDTNTS